ncbi:Diacylglycerol O-acyltransferase 2 [Chamberlinius hualienensis]
MNERVASILASLYGTVLMKVILISTILPMFLFFTPYYYFSLLYFAWFFYDRNTSATGSRRLVATYPFFLPNVVKFWPMRLIKTSDLDPNKNYVCGCHPHGVIPMGSFTNVATDINDFSLKFPGIKSTVIAFDLLFYLPIVRDLLTAFGCGSSSKKSIQYVLNEKGKGNAVFILVGGPAEICECKPNEISLILKNRKGFVKVAITNGADLVPILTFGENEAFEFKSGEMYILKTIENYVRKITGRSIYLSSLYRTMSCVLFTFLPNRKPIYTVVGKPIEVEQISNPSDETIDFYHQKYIESLQQLFHDYKTQFGNVYQNHTLTIK